MQRTWCRAASLLPLTGWLASLSQAYMKKVWRHLVESSDTMRRRVWWAVRFRWEITADIFSSEVCTETVVVGGSITDLRPAVSGVRMTFLMWQLHRSSWENCKSQMGWVFREPSIQRTNTKPGSADFMLITECWWLCVQKESSKKCQISCWPG